MKMVSWALVFYSLHMGVHFPVFSFVTSWSFVFLLYHFSSPVYIDSCIYSGMEIGTVWWFCSAGRTDLPSF